MTEALLRAAIVRLAPSPGSSGTGPLERARAAARRLLLRALLRRRHLVDALDLLGGTETGAPAGEGARIVDALRRAGSTCLDRSLAGYAALRSRNEEVTFVLGVRRTGDDLLAHAWLERAGAPLGESEDPRSRFAVAFVHPRPAPPAPFSEEPPVSAFVTHPDVILTELRDGTGVLLHLGTKFYFALNATGVVAWKLLASRDAPGAKEIALEIARRFSGVDPEAARRDVEALLAELAAEGLARTGVGAP